MTVFLASLAACSGFSGEGRSPGGEQLLQNNLSVASAALAAGQPAVARKLYLALTERFEDAPEPVLGLGYIALQAGAPGDAKGRFLEAAELAEDAPGVKAEALLGAARASLALSDTGTARRHLAQARTLAEDPSSIAWIENGLAVAAVFEEDYATAETHYVRALRQPAAHPRIAANYVRMLIASGRVDEAARTFAAHTPSWWEENDRQALEGLIEEARRPAPAPVRLEPRLLLRLSGIRPRWAWSEVPAHSAERHMRDGHPGLVLLAGERRFPASPVTGAAAPAVPASTNLHSSEPSSAVPRVPAAPGDAPESLLPVRGLESARAAIPVPETDGSRPLPPAGRARSSSPDVLVLRIGAAAAAPGHATEPEPAPHAGWARAGGFRSRLLDGERRAPHAETGMTPAAYAGVEDDGLREGPPSASSSSVPSAPAAGAAPGTTRWTQAGGPAAAGASPSRTPEDQVWAHHLGPDPAESADALLVTAALRFGSSPALGSSALGSSALGSSELPSSPVALGRRPGAATAAPREEREVAAAPAAPASTAPEPGPAGTAGRAIVSAFPDSGPLAPTTGPDRPIVLASASPELDLYLWEPGLQARDGVGMTAATTASADRDDRIPKLAEAGAADPAPGGEWTVLLGTGQRLTLGVAASAVAIASPDVADVQLLSPRVLFVMGRNLGRTTVTVLGEDGSVFERDVSVVLDLEPLRELLAGEAGLKGVRVDRLARGVLLAGDVGSPEAADRALRLAAASLPEGAAVENGLSVGPGLDSLRALLAGERGLDDLTPLREFMAGQPGLGGVEVLRVGRSVALTGHVASAEAAERAHRLAVAALPESLPVESNLLVAFDIEPLRAVLASEPGLEGVRVRRLARGVALAGDVASQEAAERALRLAAASLPEGLAVENNLDVGLDLTPLRSLLSGEAGLEAIEVRRVGRSVALTGEVASPEAADRAHRLVVASLPESVAVQNNLRVAFDIEPLRALLAGEPGLAGVQVQRLARGVALSGDVDLPATADLARRLAAASLPAGLLVEDNLSVVLNLEPLRVLLAAEADLQGVRVKGTARGVALVGDVASAAAADRALRLASSSLPEGMAVEDGLRVVDLEPLRALLAGESDLQGVAVESLARGVTLVGDVASTAAADRALRLAASSLPDGFPVENQLRVVDLEPLRALLAGDADLQDVRIESLGRSVALSGDVASAAAADRALRLAASSLPDGFPVENGLRVVDLGTLRVLIAGEPGLRNVVVTGVGTGVALTGEAASAEAAERARRLAEASLPEGMPVENNLRVEFDIEPLRAVLAAEPDLDRVQVKRLPRGVALAGEVASPEAADRALRLATASLPEGVLVENNLSAGLDLAPLRALLAGEPGLAGVQVQRVGRGVALTGDVASAEASDRAHRLAAASLPDTVPVENNLRVVFDIEPLRAVLAAEPGLGDVRVRQLARGVALGGPVGSAEAAERAVGLAAASLPAGIPIDNHLSVGLDLEPLRALLAGERGLEGVEVRRVGRGVALTGEVASAEAAERAHRLALASLPERLPVENNVRVSFDLEPLRTVLAAESGLEGIQVRRLLRGVALAGDVASPEAADRALRLAAASLPVGILVENNLDVVLDLEPLRALLAGESGLEGVLARPLGRGIALTGEVASPEAAERARRLAVASLPEGVPVENELRVVDLEPLRKALAEESDLQGVQVESLARGVALVGDVASPAAADRALRLASSSLTEGLPVESRLRVVDLDPLRALFAGDPGLRDVQVQRRAGGIALAGDVDSPAAVDRAIGLAAASLPDGMPVENDLRIVFDLEPLRALLAAEPDLRGVRAEARVREAVLAGDVASQAAVDRALGLAASSLPDGLPVENELRVVDLEPLRALLAAESGMQGVRVQNLARGVAVVGGVDSPAAADRALGLAAATLPEGMPVENRLRVVFDVEPLRALLAGEAGLRDIAVKKHAGGVSLTGQVASPEAADRALRLATSSLPAGIQVENDLEVGLDLGPLRALLASEAGLHGVEVQRVGRGMALTGSVASAEASERAHRLAVASLPAGLPVDNNLRVVFDVAPLRAVLAAEAGLEGVEVRQLARGVALAGPVGSAEAAERAVRLAAASLPAGIPIENHLSVGLDLGSLRALLAGEAGLEGVEVRRVGRGVALTGEVASAEASDRAHRLAAASLPESVPVENNLRLEFDIEPLRALLSGEPRLHLVHVQRLPRGVALTGEVASPAAADLALRLAAASLPEGLAIESNLSVGLDLRPLRALLSGDPGLARVRVPRVGQGVALTGEVASAEAVERAVGLAAASLPESVPVQNNLRVELDIEPLRTVLADEPGLEGIQVRRLPRGVALSGDVDSQEAADRALRLAAASLPDGASIESGLDVGLDLGPLRGLMAGEPGLGDVEVRRVGRGVALTGDVGSAEASDRAHRLAVAALPEGMAVENNLRVVFDIVPLRVLLAGEEGLAHVEVRRLARGVALKGYVDSPETAERALGLASASLPEGLLLENNLTVGLGLEPLRAYLAGEPGLDDLAPLRAFVAGEPGLEGVAVQRVGRGVALTGEVASPEAAERARRLAVAALPETVPVENNLRVVFDIVPLRVLLAGEAGLARVHVQRLARGVALAGYVDSAVAEDRALRLAAASLPEGLAVENNLDVGLDLAPLRALLAGEAGLEGVAVRRVGRGVALTGAVASADAADRAYRLAVASLPESVPAENNLRVVFDVAPLRAVLAAEPGLEGIHVRQLARGVALAGEVASPETADRARRLAVASLPEGLAVENNLDVGLDLAPLRALLAGEAGLDGVAVRRVGRGVALTGAVASAEAADRAHRLAVASLPESVPAENNLRVVFDVAPLRAVLAAEPGLEGIEVRQLARGVALAGDVASPETADRARRLAVASLPEGLLVENNLGVVPELGPLRALLMGESGLEGVEVRRVGRGVALVGEVASPDAAGHAHRLASAALPEGMAVENNLRVAVDIDPLRALLAGEPGLDRIRVQELGRGVVLTGEVASAAASERAQRIAAASLPEGVPVENSLLVVPDIDPLRAALAGEPGMEGVQVQRLARGVALSGDVASHAAEDWALRLAAASLPEGVPVENNLSVGLDLAPLRSLVAGESSLEGVRVQRTGRGVALIGAVGSAEASERASRLAAALLPEDVSVENNLRVVWDVGPLRTLLAGSPELERVQVRRLARGVALSGEVDSHAAADLALRLAAASLPEGVLVESSLDVRLDLAPLRALIAGEPELRNVRVKRMERGVALSGEVGSAEASDRALRLAVASLPEGVAVENGLRVAPDVEPLRALLAGEPGLERVQVRKLARGVALAGDVASPKAADRALRLAAASLPDGMLVENNLNVGLELAPLKALMTAEAGFAAILVKRIERGVALTGDVGSAAEAERAARLAAASLPEGALVENNLRVVPDTRSLRTALAEDPAFEGVQVRGLAHGVSLRGEVASVAAADRALRLAAVSLPPGTPVENDLRIAGPLQVNLEVQIAEVQRSIAENFGFSWELFGRSADGDLRGGFRIGRQNTTQQAVVDGLLSPSFVLTRTWEEIGITGLVDALARAGLANVLARPNVTANSGETASFFSGGEFPLPSGYSDGVITFEYKKYGVLLDFVPTIVDDGRVELTVRPEVSEPSRDNSVQIEGIEIPVMNVRRAETTVEMGDGESIVIAGLFSSASDEVQSGVPVLKDLPLLGGLFGQTSTRADELELIVSVTARLVQAGPSPAEAGASAAGQAGHYYY